jgi:hypothetical protein
MASTETNLYQPIKDFLYQLGFEAKGEVCGCDVVALNNDEPVALIICELKLSFSLELILQAVDRSTACDEIWIAVQAKKNGRGRESDPRAKKLCRYLGFGLLRVDPSNSVEVIVKPQPWKPRRDTKLRSRILEEYNKRQGDPSVGGSTRKPIMTAYRQQAILCARTIDQGVTKLSELKKTVPDAAKILQRNVYGWFNRRERGHYVLSDSGKLAIHV